MPDHVARKKQQVKEHAERQARRRLLRRRLAIVGGLLIIVTVLAGGWAYSRWSSAPSWWRRHQAMVEQTDNATFIRMADSLDSRVTRAVSADLSVADPQAEHDQELFIPFDEINAWLRVKLEDYLAHHRKQLPSELRDFMVLSDDDGQLGIACEVNTPELQQVVHLWLEVTLEADGRLSISPEGIYAGQLPVPMTMVVEHLNKNAGTIQEMIKLESGDQTYYIDPVWKHPGEEGMNLRLVGLQIEEDGIRAQLRSQPVETAAAEVGDGADEGVDVGMGEGDVDEAGGGGGAGGTGEAGDRSVAGASDPRRADVELR